MTDRELLEAAAMAVGMNVLTVPWPRNPDGWFWCDHSGTGPGLFKAGNAIFQGWSPLTDDGDALRLAVSLRISLDMLTHIVDATTGTVMCHEPWSDDHNAATRRAIVRAAAAMAVG